MLWKNVHTLPNSDPPILQPRKKGLRSGVDETHQSSSDFFGVLQNVAGQVINEYQNQYQNFPNQWQNQQQQNQQQQNQQQQNQQQQNLWQNQQNQQQNQQNNQQQQNTNSKYNSCIKDPYCNWHGTINNGLCACAK